MFFAGGLTPDMPRADLEHVLALYDGEIAWTDHYIGRILADLRRLGLEASTVVMLLSDHGEEFYEHGLRGHRLALFEESIRIPLIVRWPGRVPAGLRVPDQAAMIDVMPTLLDLAGVPVGGEVMGRSLAPLFEGRALPPGPAAVSELYSLGNELRSFRHNDRKLIDNESLRRQLYIDLEKDPEEQRFIRDASDPKFDLLVGDAREAMSRIERFRAAMPVENKPPTLPDDLKRQLVELGYLEAE
jgi:arylsulfatase A-like enzyme